MHRVETARVCVLYYALSVCGTYSSSVSPAARHEYMYYHASKFIYASRVRISINVQLTPALCEVSRDVSVTADVSRSPRRLCDAIK